MSRSLRTSNLSFRMTRKFVWFFSRFKEERELTGEECIVEHETAHFMHNITNVQHKIYRCFLNGSAIAVQCRNSSSHGIHKEELKLKNEDEEGVLRRYCNFHTYWSSSSNSFPLKYSTAASSISRTEFHTKLFWVAARDEALISQGNTLKGSCG